METVTFSHLVTYMGGRSFMMSSITTRGLVNNIAAVFIDSRSLALGAEYEILQFLVVECTLLTLRSTV